MVNRYSVYPIIFLRSVTYHILLLFELLFYKIKNIEALCFNILFVFVFVFVFVLSLCHRRRRRRRHRYIRYKYWH